MNLPDKIRGGLQELIFPHGAAYDQRRRERRVIIWTLIGGIIFAVVFGFMLYYLNWSGRFEH